MSKESQRLKKKIFSKYFLVVSNLSAINYITLGIIEINALLEGY